ncbi:MAG: FAD-dependent oxidoreductase [Bacteroidota bacterium]|nr:FAD-dependent oxidoreductase [Bacteroidota bacterium]
MKNNEVIIIGGGVIGCAVAYYVAKKGINVMLIDQPKRGRATSASAGGLWPLGESIGLGCGVIFHKAMIEKGLLPADSHIPPQLPKSFLDFAIQSNEMFPSLTGAIKELSGIDFEYEETSLLFLMYDDADVAFAKTLYGNCPCGNSRIDWLTPFEVKHSEPAITHNILGALRFNGDNQVNPYALADGYREAARKLGATIITHTEVTGIKINAGRVSGVETKAGFFPSKYVVNAAGAWAAQVGEMAGVEIPVYPVRGQIIGTEAMPKILSACISTNDCYIAQKHHGEIIIGSTTEETGFNTDITPSAINSLCKGAVRAIPFLEKAKVKRVWSGLRPGTADELPILGKVKGVEGYINACGHFRTGILNSPLTGLLISEMINEDQLSFPIEPFLLSEERLQSLTNNENSNHKTSIQ